MIGHGSEARIWEHQAHADCAPTLAAAPKGLSVRRVERWLDLPPGAWQRRRLYALRLSGNTFCNLGFQQGDVIIVEPGKGEQPGRIVVTRGARGMSLRRIPSTGVAERRMPTVLELPLREKGAGCAERIVGIVVGALRATGTGALRPIPGTTKTRQRRTGRRVALAPQTVSPRVRSFVSPDELASTRRRWKIWLAVATESETSVPTPSQRERWARLDASLSILCECLARTHSPELRKALTAEAAGVVSAVHREIGG